VPRSTNWAIDKHGNNDQEFCVQESYVLLYPDLKEVIHLPGTLKEFNLKQYKEYFGKPYSQIVFYLCITSDYLDTPVRSPPSGANNALSDEDDQLFQHQCVQICYLRRIFSL